VFPVSSELDHVGPLAPTVGGVAALLSCLADTQANPAYASGVEDELEGGVTDCRIGFIRQYEGIAERFQPAVWRAFADAQAALRSEGARLVSVDLPALHGCHDVHRILFEAGVAVSHQRLWPRHAAEYGEAARARVVAAGRITAQQVGEARSAQARLTKSLSQILATVDILITPAAPFTAPRIEEAEGKLRATRDSTDSLSNRTALPFGLAGLPAVVVPAGRDAAGLPVAVQLAAGRFRDRALLRAARALERARSGPLAP